MPAGGCRVGATPPLGRVWSILQLPLGGRLGLDPGAGTVGLGTVGLGTEGLKTDKSPLKDYWFGRSFYIIQLFSDLISKHVIGSKERHLLGQDKSSKFSG